MNCTRTQASTAPHSRLCDAKRERQHRQRQRDNKSRTTENHQNIAGRTGTQNRSSRTRRANTHVCRALKTVPGLRGQSFTPFQERRQRSIHLQWRRKQEPVADMVRPNRHCPGGDPRDSDSVLRHVQSTHVHKRTSSSLSSRQLVFTMSGSSSKTKGCGDVTSTRMYVGQEPRRHRPRQNPSQKGTHRQSGQGLHP